MGVRLLKFFKLQIIIIELSNPVLRKCDKVINSVVKSVYGEIIIFIRAFVAFKIEQQVTILFIDKISFNT